MRLTSPSFKENGDIPAAFTCDGKDSSPELLIDGAPEGTKSLALIVDDPDAPGGTWTHWTVWNIGPGTTTVSEGKAPQGAAEGATSFGKPGYGGPCPPSGAPHRYFFKLYALDAALSLPAGSAKDELEREVSAHLLASAELVGLYGR